MKLMWTNFKTDNAGQSLRGTQGSNSAVTYTFSSDHAESPQYGKYTQNSHFHVLELLLRVQYVPKLNILGFEFAQSLEIDSISMLHYC